jgi:hypothetical protein
MSLNFSFNYHTLLFLVSNIASEVCVLYMLLTLIVFCAQRCNRVVHKIHYPDIGHMQALLQLVGIGARLKPSTAVVAFSITDLRPSWRGFFTVKFQYNLLGCSNACLFCHSPVIAGHGLTSRRNRALQARTEFLFRLVG